jgi:hypothetical protein
MEVAMKKTFDEIVIDYKFYDDRIHIETSCFLDGKMSSSRTSVSNKFLRENNSDSINYICSRIKHFLEEGIK